MYVEKLSVSLPSPLIQFIEVYREAHQCRSRSQVLETALELLRERELEKAYAKASLEVDHDFDSTTGDGLSDESW